MGTVSNLLAAFAAFFGWKRDKQQLDNTPAKQARAQGATDQEIKDRANQAIKTGNLEQIRQDLAE